MSVKINLKRAERKVLDAADYLLEITLAEQREAKVSGNQNLHIEAIPDAEMHPEAVGAKLYLDLSLQEQSWYRTVELLEAVNGEPLEAENEDGDLQFEPEELVGKKVGASVVVDNAYDGIDRNKITGFFPVGEFESEQESEQESDE